MLDEEEIKGDLLKEKKMHEKGLLNETKRLNACQWCGVCVT